MCSLQLARTRECVPGTTRMTLFDPIGLLARLRCDPRYDPVETRLAWCRAPLRYVSIFALALGLTRTFLPPIARMHCPTRVASARVQFSGCLSRALRKIWLTVGSLPGCRMSQSRMGSSQASMMRRSSCSTTASFSISGLSHQISRLRTCARLRATADRGRCELRVAAVDQGMPLGLCLGHADVAGRALYEREGRPDLVRGTPHFWGGGIGPSIA
jgi:hypothetical protein